MFPKKNHKNLSVQFFNFNNPDPLYTLKFESELNKNVHTWENKINDA